MNEATPHLHIDFVSYTSGNKREQETKNTLKGALEKPDIAIDEQEHRPIGKYGLLREQFLKEYRTGTYTRLLLTGEFNSHLFEVDTLVHQHVDEIVAVIAKAEGADEDLKVSNQMEWVGRMNNYKACADEIVLNEIICV